MAQWVKAHANKPYPPLDFLKLLSTTHTLPCKFYGRHVLVFYVVTALPLAVTITKLKLLN